MSKLSRNEFKELLIEWNKFTNSNSKNNQNKNITEVVDLITTLSDIGQEIVKYSPVVLGSVAASAGISKIRSSFAERKKRKSIKNLSILFIERFISEINEDLNNDLKAQQAKEKYNEAAQILNQVKSLNYNEKDCFIALQKDEVYSRQTRMKYNNINERNYEKLLSMKTKLFEIYNFFLNGNMHFVFQESSNENITEINENVDAIKQKISNIADSDEYVNSVMLAQINSEVLEDIKDTMANNSNFFKTLIAKKEFDVYRSNSDHEWSKLYSSSVFYKYGWSIEKVDQQIKNLYFKNLNLDYFSITSFFRSWSTQEKIKGTFTFNYETDLRIIQESFEAIDIDKFCNDMFKFLYYNLITDKDQSSEVSYTRKVEFQELKEKISNIIPTSVIELDHYGTINIKPQTCNQFQAMTNEEFQNLVGILHAHQVKSRGQSNPIKVSLIKNTTNFRHLEEKDRETSIKLSEALSREMASQNAVDRIKSILDIFKILNFTSPSAFILSFLIEHGTKPLYSKLVDYLCSIDTELGRKIRNLLAKDQNQTQKKQSIDDITEYLTSDTESGRIINRIFQIILAVCL